MKLNVFCFTLISLIRSIIMVKTVKTSINEPCLSLKNNINNNSSKMIQCIGQLRNRLVIITDKDKLYELTLESIYKSNNNLYMGTNLPYQLTDRWNSLEKFTNPSLNHVKSKLLSCFTMINAFSEWLMYVTKCPNGNSTPGISFDIDNQLPLIGMCYDEDDIDNIMFIGAPEKLIFYGIFHKTNEHVRIMRYKFVTFPIIDWILYQRWSSVAQPDQKGQPSEQWYRICGLNESRLRIVKDHSAQCQMLNLNISQGLVTNEQFYLFGDEFVYTFPLSVYHMDSVDGMKYSTIRYENFIKCEGNITYINPDYTFSLWILIFGIIILSLLLLCLLSCVLCLLCIQTSRKRRKSNANTRVGSKMLSSSSLTKRSNGSHKCLGNKKATKLNQTEKVEMKPNLSR